MFVYFNCSKIKNVYSEVTPRIPLKYISNRGIWTDPYSILTSQIKRIKTLDPYAMTSTTAVYLSYDMFTENYYPVIDIEKVPLEPRNLTGANFVCFMLNNPDIIYEDCRTEMILNTVDVLPDDRLGDTD